MTAWLKPEKKWEKVVAQIEVLCGTETQRRTFYNITSPVFEKVTINHTNGKKFTIIAKGASKTKKYIQKAFINGKEINSPFITHEQIMLGATLELELSELPNKEWGNNPEIPK